MFYSKGEKQLNLSGKDFYGQLKWFTLRQLLFYHTALTNFRIHQSKEPEYLYGIMFGENFRGNIVVPFIPVKDCKLVD